MKVENITANSPRLSKTSYSRETGSYGQETAPSEIHLAEHEIRYAATIGIDRHIRAVMNGYKQPDGASAEDAWDRDIEGACAELAVAKCLNVYFCPDINIFKGQDVGGYQVRSTQNPEGKLIIRPNDSSEDTFIFITGVCPTFTVHGWILGADAKRHTEWLFGPNGRPKACFVPRTALRPISSLIRNDCN